MSLRRELKLTEVVGGGYGEFWRFKGRYRIVKGSRASKKSKTTALWFIYNMMKYPRANTLVVRKVFRTLRDSCYAELMWAAERLGVTRFWEFKQAPMEMTYKPTGQRIYFRGLDDPLKINSITSTTGGLCWLWIEEAYEIVSEDDFNMLDEAIRGGESKGAFKQVTLTFNPWDERHWLKKRFFDFPDNGDVMAITRDYRCNEFLDAADLRLFETMKKNNPRRYQVAGLGNWGVNEGAIYVNWREEGFDAGEIMKCKGIKSAFGLDFGYTNDPTALFCGLVDRENLKLYVFNELYEKGLTNARIAERVRAMGYNGEVIRADSAEPKSIDELRGLGLSRIRGARKGADSVRSGIQAIQNYSIIIHPRCTSFVREISGYVWAEDLTGRRLNSPSGGDDHLMDAMRYALEDLGGEVFSFS